MADRRGFVFGAAATLATSTACAPASPLGALLRRTAGGTPLYVPPFLDVTPGMAVGFLLTRVVQEQIYNQAPVRFVVVFDEAACAVDGSVIDVIDRVVDADHDRKRDVVLRARATLVDKRGVVRHDTGIVAKAGRYDVDPSAPADVDARRQRALQVAIVTVGSTLADLLLEMP